MAWTDLRTDYTDATFSGNKKYRMINNDDGTVSFEDVTEYVNKTNSFFGAGDANQMNAGINELMNTKIPGLANDIDTLKTRVNAVPDYIFTEDITIQVGTVNANSYYSIPEFSLEKSGCTPLGIVQYQINGTNGTRLVLNLCKIQSDGKTFWGRIFNVYNGNATNVNVVLTVLWKKNTI